MKKTIGIALGMLLLPFTLLNAGPVANSSAPSAADKTPVTPSSDSSIPAVGQPRIIHLPDQRMLVIAETGDPNQAAHRAFGKLYKTFYAHASKADKKALQAPRARWRLPLDESQKQNWAGRYGLPVSDSFPALAQDGVSVEVWQYGIMAEILHIGPYSNEGPDIAALQAYLAGNGYAIIGDHEEEYLRGPGMIFQGNPKKYRTIIRYQIERKGESVPIAAEAKRPMTTSGNTSSQ